MFSQNRNQPISVNLRGCFPNAEIWKQWCGIVGTFSVDGPKKCSGLEIKQYDENGMKEKFEKANFENIERKREDHITPAGAIQNFVFCSFMKERR